MIIEVRETKIVCLRGYTAKVANLVRAQRQEDAEERARVAETKANRGYAHQTFARRQGISSSMVSVYFLDRGLEDEKRGR